MGLVTSDGFIYMYNVDEFSRKEGSIDRDCDFRSCFFYSKPGSSSILDKNSKEEEFKMFVVGSQVSKGVVRVLN